MCERGEYLRCLHYHVHSHSVHRTGTKWHGVVLIFQVACSSPDDGSALQCDKWSHLKTQVPAKTLAKRGETDTLKIGNNWVNITQTSNCNLLHEQYSFQRSKHFLNICAICSPSRANYKVRNLPTSMPKLTQVSKVHKLHINHPDASAHLFLGTFSGCKKVICLSLQNL